MRHPLGMWRPVSDVEHDDGAPVLADLVENPPAQTEACAIDAREPRGQRPMMPELEVFAAAAGPAGGLRIGVRGAQGPMERLPSRHRPHRFDRRYAHLDGSPQRRLRPDGRVCFE